MSSYARAVDGRGPVLRDALVRARAARLRRREEVDADIGARDVPARREAGLDEQQRAVGLGDDRPVELDADMARAAQHVDAVVRVARVLEDLVVLLPPRVHRVPVEGDVPGDVGARVDRLRVVPDRVLGDPVADADREVARLALARAGGVLVRRLEQVVADVLQREVVDGEMALLEEDQDAVRVGDGLAAEHHADALDRRFDRDDLAGPRPRDHRHVHVLDGLGHGAMVADARTGRRGQSSCSSTYASTGSRLPLSVTGPRFRTRAPGSSRSVPAPIATPPTGAAPCSRAATLTVSPMTV